MTGLKDPMPNKVSRATTPAKVALAKPKDGDECCREI